MIRLTPTGDLLEDKGRFPLIQRQDLYPDEVSFGRVKTLVSLDDLVNIGCHFPSEVSVRVLVDLLKDRDRYFFGSLSLPGSSSLVGITGLIPEIYGNG